MPVQIISENIYGIPFSRSPLEALGEDAVGSIMFGFRRTEDNTHSKFYGDKGQRYLGVTTSKSVGELLQTLATRGLPNIDAASVVTLYEGQIEVHDLPVEIIFSHPDDGTTARAGLIAARKKSGDLKLVK